MTIHELMNKSPVTPDVYIRVFNCYGDRIIYSGKYEDSTQYIFGLEVNEFDIQGIATKAYNPGQFYITHARIIAEIN